MILLIDLKLKTKSDADATSGYNWQVKEAERVDSRRNDEVAAKRDLGLLKQELIERIDTNGTKIETNGEKIEGNGKKIEANSRRIETNGEKIEANGEKIDANTKAIEANSEKIARLTTKVVENHDAISKTLAREEYKRDHDQMMVILLRTDQERVVPNARLGRLEAGRN